MSSILQLFPDRRRPALREPAALGHMKIIDRMPPLRPADTMQRIRVMRVARSAAPTDQPSRMGHPDAPGHAINRHETLKDAEQIFARHELATPLVREHRLFLGHDALLSVTHEHFRVAGVPPSFSILFFSANLS